MGRVKIEELTDDGVFARLRAEWDALLQDAPASPFDTWEWRATWWRHYGAGRCPRLLAARDDEGALVGLWPLFEERLPPARRWRQVGNGVTGADYLDLIARPGWTEAVREAALAHLAARRTAWDRLDLEDLPATSPTVARVKDALGGARVSSLVQRRFFCPYLPLEGSFEDYLAHHPRRDNYRRRLRALQKVPGFAVRCVTRPEEAAEAMATLLDLHRRRWEQDGGSQGIGPREERFHREVAPLFAARGWLRMYELCAGGRPVASVYGIERNGTFFYYQSGLDPSWSRQSAGLVLLGLLVEDLFRRGVRELDFLRGSEPYKGEWAPRRRETVSVRVTAWTLAAAALWARERSLSWARGAARQVLPAPLAERLRRLSRRARAARVARALEVA